MNECLIVIASKQLTVDSGTTVDPFAFRHGLAAQRTPQPRLFGWSF